MSDDKASSNGETPRPAVDLKALNATGWYDRLRNESEDYAQAEEIIGRRFLALSLVAGLRVVSLVVDREVRSMSTVGFSMAENEEVFHASLLEFRRIIVQVLAAPDSSPVALPPGPVTRESLQTCIGVRFVLIAELFGIVLRELNFADSVEPTVVFSERSAEGIVGEEHLVGDGAVKRSLLVSAFREELRGRVAGDFQASLADLVPEFPANLAAEAEKALAEEDFDLVAATLGDWPGKVAALLRLGDRVDLTTLDTDLVANAMLNLIRALRRSGKTHEAEEVARVLLQWLPKSPTAAACYGELAEVLVQKGASGQAIGYFRRALSMGAGKALYLPSLAKCFAARGRYVAAAMCVRDAREAGVSTADMSELESTLHGHLGNGLQVAFEKLDLATNS